MAGGVYAATEEKEKRDLPQECVSLKHVVLILFLLLFVVIMSLLIWLGPSKMVELILQFVMPQKPDFWYALLIGALISMLMVAPLPVVFIIILVPGLVFGFWTATLILFLGISTGVTLAFILGRWVLQDLIRGWILKGGYPQLQAIFHTLETDEDTIKLLILYRFVPIPFFPKNYGPTVLELPFWKLVLSAIPHHIWASLLFASLGTTFKDFAELLREGDTWDWKNLPWQNVAMICAWLACSGLISLYAYWIFSKKATEHTEENAEKTPLLEHAAH